MRFSATGTDMWSGNSELCVGKPLTECKESHKGCQVAAKMNTTGIVFPLVDGVTSYAKQVAFEDASSLAPNGGRSLNDWRIEAR
jgi:hypothetical protein